MQPARPASPHRRGSRGVCLRGLSAQERRHREVPMRTQKGQRVAPVRAWIDLGGHLRGRVRFGCSRACVDRPSSSVIAPRSIRLLPCVRGSTPASWVTSTPAWVAPVRAWIDPSSVPGTASWPRCSRACVDRPVVPSEPCGVLVLLPCVRGSTRGPSPPYRKGPTASGAGTCANFGNCPFAQTFHEQQLRLLSVFTPRTRFLCEHPP